jgi:hypothetical protein
MLAPRYLDCISAINDEYEGIWKEAEVADTGLYPGIWLEEMRTTKNRSNPAPP